MWAIFISKIDKQILTWKLSCKLRFFIEFIDLPHVILLAVGFAVPHKTRASLVEELLAGGTLEARRVPFEVRGHPQDPLVMNPTPASDALRTPSFWQKDQLVNQGQLMLAI